ncbi:MAG: DUF4350 domain-containing protein [bacterium]|nr:DUF4350 domain-containing protein [bacterium]
MTLARRFLLTGAATLLVSGLSGCPWCGTPAPRPTPPPAPIPTPVESLLPGESHVFSTWTNLVNGQLTIQVRRSIDRTPVARAQVTLRGATPAWGRTDSNGQAVLTPLDAGRHVVRIQAPGLASREIVVDDLVPGSPATFTVDLEPAAGAVSGRVLDASGNPIRAAVVSHALGATLTGEDGRFTLQGLAAGQADLSVRRGGFAPGSWSGNLGGAATEVGDLRLAAAPIAISLENPDQVLDRPGGTARTIRDALSPLTTRARAENMAWGERLDGATVRLVVAPSSTSLDAATCDRLETFARAGGHLVLAGEWGGAAGYSPAAMLELTRRFGVGVEPTLVRPSPGDETGGFTTAAIAPWLPRSGTGSLRFRAAGTLFLPPSGLVLVGSPENAYRIANVEVAGWPLVGMMAVGNGRVTLLADSSLLVSGDDPGSDRGNQDFMIDLLRL